MLVALVVVAAAVAEAASPTVAAIQSFAAVVAAVVAAVGAVYAGRAHREARSAKVEARGAHVNAFAANHAVNNTPPGAPTLVQRVGDLEVHAQCQTDHTRWQTAAVETIAEQIGVELPPPPSS